MKNHRKTVAIAGLLLTLFAVLWWLCVRTAQVSQPRVNFIGFTNNIAGKRMAAFSLNNAAEQRVLFAPVIELQTKDGNYERWAAGPPERPPTTLAPSGVIILETAVPDPGCSWRLRLIWQVKPTTADYVYARGLDVLLKVWRSAGGDPPHLVPSFFIWHDILITHENLPEPDAEPTASPNAAAPHR